MNSLQDIKQIPDLRDRFRELASLYAEYCNREGLKVVPFASPELTVFSRHPVERQQEAIHHLSRYVEVFEEMTAERISLRDSPKLLWRCLIRLGLTPPADIFDKITDGTVVEIYSLDQRQLFHNLKLWDFITYTVEQVFGCEWWRMTRRDPGVAQKIHECAIRIASGQATGTFDPQIEEHLVEELIEEQGSNRFMLKLLCMAPVRSQGQIAGLLAVNHSRLLAPLSSG